ncbi:MAG: DUF3341 domain-containing protein [Anaerolineae bacterium]|nr:DUF3341 domain-containing protein [Anaerolineae bacterium]
MNERAPKRNLFGVIARFEEAGDLLVAAKRAYAAGYRQLDAYTPFPVHGLSEALGLDKQPNFVPYLVLLGAIFGGLAGYMLQYYTSVIAYPLNIGSRPLNSWPAFMVITFEGAVLMAAVAGVLGMLFLNKLPMPYHPVFNTPNFNRASRDAFFLCVLATDPRFDEQETGAFLKSLHPSAVHAVEQGDTEIYD